MTCVVSSPWHSPNSTYGWWSMNPEDIATPTSAAGQTQYGYLSSESESRHHSSGSAKKRASRAGTRSVSTLSAAQLERKRANDREAQRAIRQRTKDHIDHLERNINDLRAANDASEKIAAGAHQRSRELEEENAYLRTKLGEVGYAVAVPPAETQRAPDQHLLTVHTTSPAAHGASIPRPESTSTPRSSLSVSTSQSSSSRHGSWQQGTTHFGVTAATTPASLPAHSAAQIGPGVTPWRSHDSAQSVHRDPAGMQDQQSLPQHPPYLASNSGDRAWGVPQSYPYQEQQRTPSQVQESPAQPHYAQNPMPSYAPGSTPQPQSYVGPPQNEFQGMTVQSPANYQVPQQQDYAQQPHYQMAQVLPAPTAPEYAHQPAHIHPPEIIPAAYPHLQGEQQYGQQQVSQPMQYREDPNTNNRGYSMTNYPSG